MTSPLTTSQNQATDERHEPVEIVVHSHDVNERIASAAFTGEPCRHPDHDARWLRVLSQSMGHTPYLIEAVRQGRTIGMLPLAFVRSLLFGRFLVSLPYLNSAGVHAEDPDICARLVAAAAGLTDQLDCRFLELRHESPIDAVCLTERLTTKVHMRLDLPATVEDLRNGLKAKVRNQVKKGEAQEFTVEWGREELLADFYDLFARRMRDLGTPVYGIGLFQSILKEFPDEAEICCIRSGRDPAASALLIHGAGLTEVPSASSRPEYNPRNANMFMYWQLLKRAVERGQQIFDFGRATVDSNTFRFKKQWGATPSPATWQYYVRRGSANDMRPDSGRRQLLIRAWQRLPVWLSRLIGPAIVRGIP